ncbi:MAG: HAMP domain-containing sensor histidine kinase [Candidatus Neomarinimicrobiota bacterium]|nr:HAMP domain-containing sensor histidine kinase [Candidatus Neomarinimicrobiota bacterium]
MTSSYRHIGNIKGGIFLIGVFLVIGLFSYTRYLSSELREDNREVVKLYAEIIAETVKDDSNTNIDFIFENIIKKVKFPIIQSGRNKNPQLWTNLPENIDSDRDRLKLILSMDKINKPIPLVFDDKINGPITFGYLHYGDSRLIQKIQIWTYIEILSIGIFILFGFIGFSFIRNSEKQHIWVGLSRETAHQLGTPVSALLGWLDYLKNDNSNIEKILPEMESDIERLQQVSRRFSKMGSKPEMEYFDLSKRVESVLSYLNRRIPTLGKKVDLVNDIDPDIKIMANGTLISWTIENLIRNSIDSVSGEAGLIRLSMSQDQNNVKIRISDNGCGVPKKDWKNIFRPGFSTKKSGWGLGLSLCQRIINEVHKGDIYVLESRINSGTVFEINIPSG